MNDLTGFALFCDDIRDELRGTETLVGVFPQNIVVADMPFKFAKLGVYSRIQISKNWTAGPVTCFLIFPNGETVEVGQIDDATFQTLKADSDSNEGFLGVTMMMVRGFDIPQEGDISVVLRYQSQEVRIGNLRVVLATDRL